MLSSVTAMPLRIAPLRALLLALLCWIPIATPTQADRDWRAFEPSGGLFRLQMPGVPTTTLKKRGLPMARFKSSVYKTLLDENAFGVNITSIPRALTLVVPETSLINRARNGFLEDAKATEISFQTREIGGERGKFLVYAIPAAGSRPRQRGSAWFLFKQNRLMIFYAEVDVSIPEADVQRYFDSIRFPNSG